MDSMIEVNDIQGREEGVLKPMEISIGHGHDDEKSGQQWLMSRLPTRSRRNRRCLIVLLSVILIIAVVYVVDRAHNTLENDVPNENENMQQVKNDETAKDNKAPEHNSHFDDSSKINNNNAVDGNNKNSPEQLGICIDEPNFIFRKNPKKNCDWVRQNSARVCNKPYKEDQLVKDFCRVACGDCVIKGGGDNKEDKKINISNDDSIVEEEDQQEVTKTSPEQDEVGDDGNNNNNNNNMVEEEEENQQPAIIVDEKDVFCEDLSQYQTWHETKVTKKDGVMYKIVKKYNHDSNAFTQGLTYARGQLFESDGLYGKSTVRIVDKDNANVMKKVNMDKKYFAEGLTYYKDTLVQITWKSKQGFVYNITNLEEISNFTFTTTVNQGWGITWDRCKDELIVTDGSENIHFWDPQTMKEKRRISVKRLDSTLAKEMNEIEFWRGRILANVWYEDVMLVINPETGVVEKEYDFSELWPKAERKAERADVFNGISVSANPNVLYVTGKLWDRMFTVELLPDF